MDVNAPGLQVWEMESALDGHPEIRVSAYPESHIEVTLICQALSLAAIDIDTFITILREGEGKYEEALHGGDLTVRPADDDPFVLVIDGPDGILNLHSLDVEGFIEKLLEARDVAAPPA
jgi:hypothetical protein